jgi:hypothetical protein
MVSVIDAENIEMNKDVIIYLWQYIGRKINMI